MPTADVKALKMVRQFAIAKAEDTVIFAEAQD